MEVLGLKVSNNSPFQINTLEGKAILKGVPDILDSNSWMVFTLDSFLFMKFISYVIPFIFSNERLKSVKSMCCVGVCSNNCLINISYLGSLKKN